MNAEVWYVDTSALVKTIIQEAESSALADFLQDKHHLAACDLVRVEAVRAVRMSDPGAVARARQAVRELTLIRLDDDLYEAAADLDPPLLRSLDAIHLAAALSIGRDLAGVVTYDARMADGARALALEVAAPGRARPARHEGSNPSRRPSRACGDR